MNPFRLCPGTYLLHDSSQHPFFELGLSLDPATLINVPLGFVEHPHRPDPLPLLRSVLLLILGPLAAVAAHRHDPTTVGQRAQRCIEERALIMASATPVSSEEGTSVSTRAARGVRGFQHDAESPHVADAVIEAEESAAHGGQHHVDASTLRQSEQRFSDVLCGVVHTHFGAQLPTALHTRIGACAAILRERTTPFVSPSGTTAPASSRDAWPAPERWPERRPAGIWPFPRLFPAALPAAFLPWHP